MWDILKETDIPIWLKILALSAIIVPIIYKGAQIVKSTNKSKKRDILQGVTQKDLLNHDFFNYLDDLSNSNIRTVTLVDRERTLVIKILLQHKIKVFRKRFKEFIVECDGDMDHRVLGGKFIALIYAAINEYEDKFKNEAQDKSEVEVAEFILDKFNKEHFKVGDDAIDVIERIFNSNGEKMSTYSKIYNALYTLMFPFTALFNDVLITLNKLNGELTGKTFKGRKFRSL